MQLIELDFQLNFYASNNYEKKYIYIVLYFVLQMLWTYGRFRQGDVAIITTNKVPLTFHLLSLLI